MPTIGELIRLQRVEKGLSQKKLGSMCGISDSEIHKVESGSRKTPNWNTLCLIAKALDTHPFEYMLVAGYISMDDIHPHSLINGLEQLNATGLHNLQLYVDYLLSRPEMISSPKEDN